MNCTSVSANQTQFDSLFLTPMFRNEVGQLGWINNVENYPSEKKNQYIRQLLWKLKKTVRQHADVQECVCC